MINSCVSWRSQATPLLETVLKGLSNNGLNVTFVDAYLGSAGPTHILRNGAFFERTSLAGVKFAGPLKRRFPDISQYLPKIIETFPQTV